jgi:RNA polymerase sigma factor (TIGR02999 family)
VRQASEVTRLLSELSGGNREVVDALIPLVYAELRKIASRQMRRERSDHTLDTSALVHEAYLSLARSDAVTWQDRAHFLATAAIAMRRILIDYARRKAAEKRGGGMARATFHDEDFVREARPEELLELDEALKRLEAIDERQAQVVVYKFFAGLTHDEIAEVLGMSESSVRRDWRLARTWLSREIKSMR